MLSQSVALTLQESGNNEVLGTTEFCRMMNDFFDCTNERLLHEHQRKRNGYNDLTIAAQRDIAPVVRGNVGGRYEKKKWFSVSDELVEKRKKKK